MNPHTLIHHHRSLDKPGVGLLVICTNRITRNWRAHALPENTHIWIDLPPQCLPIALETAETPEQFWAACTFGQHNHATATKESNQ